MCSYLIPKFKYTTKVVTLFIAGLMSVCCATESQPYEIKINDINIIGMEFGKIDVTDVGSAVTIKGDIKLSNLKWLPDGYIEITVDTKNQSSEVIMVSDLRKNLAVRYWSQGQMKTRYVKSIPFKSEISNINNSLLRLTINFIELPTKK